MINVLMWLVSIVMEKYRVSLKKVHPTSNLIFDKTTIDVFYKETQAWKG